MSDALDLLLDLAREEHPSDDGFVARVMADVRQDEQRTWRRSVLRRPMVIGAAAAVLVTGGTVAAVVGTNPGPERTQAPKTSAPVDDVRKPSTSVTVTAAPAPVTKPRAAAPAPSKVVTDTSGFLTDHTAFIRDAKTGLLLQTETYTNEFVVGKDHRVTITLENTGTKPVRFSAARGCALQVMAFPEGSNSAPAYQAPEDYSGRFEWECAGSDADPRTQPFTEDFVLAPGERRTADAYVKIGSAGEWKIGGMCRCSYSRQDDVGTPPKSDPLTELFRRALPSALLPEPSDGRDLVTPGIIVRAR